MNMQIDFAIMGWIAFATVSLILLFVVIRQYWQHSSSANLTKPVLTSYETIDCERDPLIAHKRTRHISEYNNICSDDDFSDTDSHRHIRRPRYIYAGVDIENRRPGNYYRRDHPSMMYRTEYAPYRTVLEHMDMNAKYNGRMYQPMQHSRPMSYREMKKSAANSPSTTACSPLPSSVV